MTPETKEAFEIADRWANTDEDYGNAGHALRTLSKALFTLRDQLAALGNDYAIMVERANINERKGFEWQERAEQAEVQKKVLRAIVCHWKERLKNAEHTAQDYLEGSAEWENRAKIAYGKCKELEALVAAKDEALAQARELLADEWFENWEMAHDVCHAALALSAKACK